VAKRSAGRKRRLHRARHYMDGRITTPNRPLEGNTVTNVHPLPAYPVPRPLECTNKMATDETEATTGDKDQHQANCPRNQRISPRLRARLRRERSALRDRLPRGRAHAGRCLRRHGECRAGCGSG
jgi:hypothetical protein